jgi:hypothetical protein
MHRTPAGNAWEYGMARLVEAFPSPLGALIKLKKDKYFSKIYEADAQSSVSEWAGGFGRNRTTPRNFA